MKNSLLIIFFSLLLTGVQAQTMWQVDPYHSSLNFNIEHSGISIVNGKFTDFTGTMEADPEKFGDVDIKFTIQTTSINTNVEPRDNHLRSADFFDVEKYPTIKFHGTKLLPTGMEDKYLLYGKLTMKDVTKDVILDVYYGGMAKSDDGAKLGFKAKTMLDRFDYNIDYDPTAAGIAGDVKIIIHAQFQEKK